MGKLPADLAPQRTETIEGCICIPGDRALGVRTYAKAIARAAHHVTYVLDACLNSTEWAVRTNDAVPFGMERSPYLDRIAARPGFEAELARRTLTILYNQGPTWLAQVSATQDAAVSAPQDGPTERRR